MLLETPGDAKSVGGSDQPRPRIPCLLHPSQQAVVILLCGGDKRTQSRDIRKAMEIAEKLED
ncbi:hypothetical protein CQ10_37175 [Bradyrhizobium valentinum]|uniref:Addiction module antitoxin RelB n=1 Tax=Bradyrhizobium valentinum TaxID=1518501 RepID=A0A0R3K883_9BRAD|nr:hypothetical protein CQ10_37175 [Bradyrhizobium valentinum]KRQ93166.1 hypothetical protein CP49_13570 [Bradyrhizobium valentinum]